MLDPDTLLFKSGNQTHYIKNGTHTVTRLAVYVHYNLVCKQERLPFGSSKQGGLTGK
jgi:hypothetical protein